MSWLAAAGVVLALVVAVCGVWRWAAWPCPAWLVPLLENPYVEAVAGSATLLQRAGIRSGMRVLDAGCGPGRVTIPAAACVGPSGRVVALDLQPAMLERLEERVRALGLSHVELVRAGLGEGTLPAGAFDAALLITVLGEIPDKAAALKEIHRSLRPGGVLSITEVLPDPHYQPVSRVRELARNAGFLETAIFRGWVSFTVNLRKPAAGGSEAAAPAAGRAGS